MAAPARKRGFSVVTVAKANLSLISFVEASAFARYWLFMYSINSSKLVRKEFASEAEANDCIYLFAYLTVGVDKYHFRIFCRLGW